MRNIFYLILAVLFFAAAYVIWAIANEQGVMVEPRTRSLSPHAIGPPPSGLIAFIQQWQPVLSLVSSVGGLLSFIFQVRIWMRSRESSA